MSLEQWADKVWLWLLCSDQTAWGQSVRREASGRAI